MFNPVDELAEEVITVLDLRGEDEWRPEWEGEMRRAVSAALAVTEPDVPYGDFTRVLRQQMRHGTYDAVFVNAFKHRELLSNTRAFELTAVLCAAELRNRNGIETWPRVQLSVCGFPIYGRVMPMERSDVPLTADERHVLFEERVTPEKVGKPRAEWPRDVGELGGLFREADLKSCPI